MISRREAVLALTGVGAAFLTGCSAAPVPGASPKATATPFVYEHVDIGGVEADEALVSQTAEDWATGADYVAAVRVDSEREYPYDASRLEEQGGLIMRTVTLSVQEVVWRHPDTKTVLPAAVSFTAMGWRQHEGKRSRIGMGGQPYLMVGHTYLAALRYYVYGCPGRQDPGDDDPGEGWGPLGSGAVTPFDSALGTGEFEGRGVERAGESDHFDTLRKEMVGKDLAWVSDRLTALRAANPKLTHTTGPLAECFRK